MKKKLFLFGTCFFLLSSLAISLTYRNIRLSNRNLRLSEIIKREEEVKKSLKELEEQKGKSSANQDEDYLDDLPWLLNRKGAIIPLVVCDLIAVPTGRIIVKKISKEIPINTEILIIDTILLTILFFSLPPFLLAIAKYKDRSYKERYYLLWRDYWKPFVCFTLSWLFFLILIFPYDDLFRDVSFEETYTPVKSDEINNDFDEKPRNMSMSVTYN